MTEELNLLREALRRVKDEAASLADAQVIALEALTQRPAAQDEREADEVFLPRRLAATQKLTQLGYRYDSAHGKWLPAPQQATPDQFADASKMVAQVTLRSVHLTRDTAGMCVVRINGRVAIRDNGDLIDHTATLEWFADTQQATPEPVGEVFQFHPMPEGWPARFRCDSCDGNGEIGELVSAGHFQPPERQTCPDCGGRGWTSEEHAFNADHMREFAEAHALLTRPAPGVPEGWRNVIAGTLKTDPWDSARVADYNSGWNDCQRKTLRGLERLAAAQAKGDDK